MTHVALSCGFEADIDEASLNDMEFLDALTAMQEGDATGMSKMCSILFPDKADKKRLYDACRDEYGRAPVDAVGGQLTELMQQLGSKKK